MAGCAVCYEAMRTEMGRMLKTEDAQPNAAELADEEAVVHEGGDEREDRGADVQCVVLPSLHAHIDGQVRVDVGGGGGHGRTH